MAEIVEIPIGKIEVGKYDMRLQKTGGSIDELAASICKFGILVPLIINRIGDRYVLVAGHRRLQAAKVAGLSNVPVVFSDGTHAEEIQVSFVENFFREDLSPVELASAIKDCYTNEVLTAKELADGFHRSEHWVHSMIAISGWPGDVLEAIHEKKISVAAGSSLAVITDSAYRGFLVRNAVEQGATARTTASWLQAWRAMQPQEEAITSEPVSGQPSIVPLVPQAPCLCCGQVFLVNQMSHVPVCGGCVQAIRQVGMS